MDLAECPNVFKKETTSIVQMKDGTHMFAGRRVGIAPIKASRHAQMEQQGFPALQKQHQILAAPLQAKDALPAHTRAELLDLWKSYRSRQKHIDLRDAPSRRNFFQRTPYGFNFGKFRHSSHPLISLPPSSRPYEYRPKAARKAARHFPWRRAQVPQPALFRSA